MDEQIDLSKKSNYSKFKELLYSLINSERDKWYSFLYDIFIALIAIFSIIPLITLNQSPFIDMLNKLHWYFIGIFIFDYFFRWYLSTVKYNRGRKSYLYYPFSTWAIVDFLAIFPSLIGLEITQAFISLRLLRLTRIFPRIDNGFKFIFRSVFTYWRVLFLIFITFAIVVFIGGIFIFVVENEKNPEITDYWDSVWFVFVTITTIGFGDIYPYTSAGRVFAIIFYLIGLSYLSLVTATIVAGFQKQISEFRQSVERTNFNSKSKLYKKLFRDNKIDNEINKNLFSMREPYYNFKEKFEIEEEYVTFKEGKLDFTNYKDEKNENKEKEK